MAVASFPNSRLHRKPLLSSPMNPIIIESSSFPLKQNHKAISFVSADRVSNFNRLKGQRRLRWQLFCKNLNSFEKEPIIQSNSSEFPDEEGYDLGVKAALCLLKFYKSEISPILPRSCRFVPTCSEYSMIAYKKYGFVKGSILTTWRICRCNPLGGTGFDPPRWFDEELPPEH